VDKSWYHGQMSNKNHKEGERTQEIEGEGHKPSQIVPHNMILHEKSIDQGETS